MTAIRADVSPAVPRALRVGDAPLITREMDASLGENVNGPSLIRVPDWLPNPLGRYYLYFAHHHGTSIRLAYADRVEGPWTLYTPGTLQLLDTPFNEHLASPDVHVDDARREIRMYYHARNAETHRYVQYTLAAMSTDGLRFRSEPTPLDESAYWRVFQWQGDLYALAMPGCFLHSSDAGETWEKAPAVFEPTMRHSAVRVRGNALDVFYSRWGDAPEHIVHARVALTDDWRHWRPAAPGASVLWPERPYEGTDQPLAPSKKGYTYQRRQELRDPCLFEDDGQTWLLYSIAAEQGIGLARVLEG